MDTLKCDNCGRTVNTEYSERRYCTACCIGNMKPLATQKESVNDGFYCEDEIYDIVDDMEELKEYLNGLDDATLNENSKVYYKKEYVDTFANR